MSLDSRKTTRRRRARRSWMEAVARSAGLLYLARGLAVAVILSGMLLIILGMSASLLQYAGGLSVLASEEGQPSLALAGIGDFERPDMLPALPFFDGYDDVGFLPIEVASDWAGLRAPPLPTQDPAALPVTGAPEVDPTAAATAMPTATPRVLVITQSPEQLAAAAAAREQAEANALAEAAAVPEVPSVPEEPAQPTAEPQVLAPQPEPTAAPRVMPPPGPPQQILIPGIDLVAPVVLAPIHTVDVRGQIFSQWRAPDEFAAGWQEGSAQAGEPGNTVITGHHNINGEVFRRLHELSQGDDVFLLSGENAYTYKVSQVMIFEERGVGMEQRQENARWILDSDDERLTLVTCWPPESNTHRLIVVAVPNP